MRKFIGISILFLAISLTTGCLDDPISPEEQFNKDIEKIENYLDENGLTAQSTASGLHYIIELEGTGEHPASNSTVTVNYAGYLLNGNEFDATNGTPVTFPLQNLIAGWQEGIPLLKKGGKGKFFLPSYLGYGSSSPSSSIPSNSVLIFDIELVNF